MKKKKAYVITIVIIIIVVTIMILFSYHSNYLYYNNKIGLPIDQGDRNNYLLPYYDEKAAFLPFYSPSSYGNSTSQTLPKTVVITTVSDSDTPFCAPSCFTHAPEYFPDPKQYNTIACIHDCFIPASVIINPGDTVTFHNADKIVHVFASGDPMREGPDDIFRSGILYTGQTYNVTFAKEGFYKYFSMQSPWMEGIIIVGDAHPALHPVAKAGSDKIVQSGTKVSLIGVAKDHLTSSTGKYQENPITYYWKQISGEPVVLTSSQYVATEARKSRDSFIAPSVSQDTVLTFELLVKDYLYRTDTDTVSVTITNKIDNSHLVNASVSESLSYEDIPYFFTDLGISTYTDTGSFTESINSSRFSNKAITTRISNELQLNHQAITFDTKIIKIKIFDKECIVKKYYGEYRTEYDFSWFAKNVDSNYRCNVSFSLFNDVLIGDIRRYNEVYSINPLLNGNYVIHGIDLSLLPREW